jgi:hypothetical protein
VGALFRSARCPKGMVRSLRLPPLPFSRQYYGCFLPLHNEDHPTPQ